MISRSKQIFDRLIDNFETSKIKTHETDRLNKVEADITATESPPPSEQEQITEQEQVHPNTLSNTNDSEDIPLSAADVLALTQYSLQSILSPGTTTPLPDLLKQLANRALSNVYNKQMIASTPLSVPSVGDRSLASTVNLVDSSNERSQEATNSFQYRNTNAFPSFSGFNDSADSKRSLLETSRLGGDWVERAHQLLDTNCISVSLDLTHNQLDHLVKGLKYNDHCFEVKKNAWLNSSTSWEKSALKIFKMTQRIV